MPGVSTASTNGFTIVQLNELYFLFLCVKGTFKIDPLTSLKKNDITENSN